jgi:hypothetical protein
MRPRTSRAVDKPAQSPDAANASQPKQFAPNVRANADGNANADAGASVDTSHPQ